MHYKLISKRRRSSYNVLFPVGSTQSGLSLRHATSGFQPSGEQLFNVCQLALSLVVSFAAFL
jgi:hypothetical protein